MFLTPAQGTYCKRVLVVKSDSYIHAISRQDLCEMMITLAAKLMGFQRRKHMLSHIEKALACPVDVFWGKGEMRFESLAKKSAN